MIVRLSNGFGIFGFSSARRLGEIKQIAFGQARKEGILDNIWEVLEPDYDFLMDDLARIESELEQAFRLLANRPKAARPEAPRATYRRGRRLTENKIRIVAGFQLLSCCGGKDVEKTLSSVLASHGVVMRTGDLKRLIDTYDAAQRSRRRAEEEPTVS